MPEINEKGQILINPIEIAKTFKNFSRYNGGWIKSVTSIDKEKINGYSIVGEFINDRIQWITPGLYLDCSIRGSRKNQVKDYNLFRINSDGSGKLIHEIIDGDKDWAINLWSFIESEQTKSNDKEGIYSSESQSVIENLVITLNVAQESTVKLYSSTTDENSKNEMAQVEKLIIEARRILGTWRLD